MVGFYLPLYAKRHTNIFVVLREKKLQWGKRLKILDKKGLVEGL